jgi:hypothetical protein
LGCFFTPAGPGGPPGGGAPRQRADLGKAAERLWRIKPSLAVEAYTAWKRSDLVQFEPVPIEAGF